MSFDEIVQYVLLGISVLLAVLNCLTRGRYKNILSEVKKVLNYRSADYRTNPEDIDCGTVFSNLIPQYRLNKATGMLEECDPIDITKLVNSSRNVELKTLLAKLEQGNAELTQSVKSQYEDYSDDLDELANALDVAEEYREKFGLDENVSVSDIFAKIEQERDKLKTTLDTLSKAQEQPNQDQSNKEVNDNAQENVAPQE